MKKLLGLGTTETARRLDVTEATVRRWCAEQGFGVRLMGRWRIPEIRVAELEHQLRGDQARPINLDPRKN